MMNVWSSYVIVAICGCMGFYLTIDNVPSPEERIVGQWEELKWEYEKVDKAENDSVNYKHISDDVKHLIGQNLIIHKAETWIFLPEHKVRLLGENTDKTVSWTLRGRGNILQFKYDNNTIENYNLTKLDDHTLELHFDADIQARGIAKLIFKKVNLTQNAQQIEQ